jgi:hypothetical protein
VIDLRFHPLTDWPAATTPSYKRRSAVTFRASFSDTLDKLEHELGLLKARDIVVSVALSPADIRNDGWPRSSAKPPRHPGVILSFASKHGPLRYLTDSHELWQHNLRAIALGLEALRAVDRYGITERGEQYVGWKAIPQNTGTAGDAARVLGSVVGLSVEVVSGVTSGSEYARSLYRKALIAAHPDGGGSREMLEQVQEAGRRLGVA